MTITEALAKYGLADWLVKQDNMRKALARTPELQFAMAELLEEWKKEQQHE